MKAKLQQLQQTLAQGFVGRDEIFKSALLGLIAGENILLIGPPGTAKSMLARRISQVLHHDDTPDYFEYLLTKFSTPEEIFGPLSIHELKQDRFQRNITGYLPSVQIGFLDEIFKASSSILNALLTILNERKYHNGTQSLDVPLQSLVAASNELPIGQEELSALYDRFLIRRFVDYVGQNQLDELFDLTPSKQIESSQRLSIADLQQFRKQAEHVVFPAEVKQAILQIKQQFNEVFKENRDEQWSDRRFIKCLHLMRISAITNQRTEVDFSDILLLKDCIWNNPAHQEQVLELIKTELRKYDVLMPINTKNNQSQQNQQKKEKQKNTNKTVSQNVIKGYKGAGTENDPILIENVHHLKGLERDEIGKKGYYFMQVNDIDCSDIQENAWFDITFTGYFDGNNKQIIANHTLFHIVENAELKNINITAPLAGIVKSTTVENCHSTSTLFEIKFDKLIDNNNSREMFINLLQVLSNSLTKNYYNYDHRANIENSTIKNCSAGKYIAWKIIGSEISQCKSNAVLCRDYIENSTISDCIIYLKSVNYNYHREYRNNNYDNFHYAGGVCRHLNNASIKRCYTAGTLFCDHPEYAFIFSGFSQITKGQSVIQDCFLGEILNGDNTNHYFRPNYNARITYDFEPDLDILKNNYALDTNEYRSFGDANYQKQTNGDSISKSLFNQYFFEHNLGWDFEHIWQWNDTDNCPELQPYRGHATPHSPDEPVAGQQSRLQHQMQNNIWL